MHLMLSDHARQRLLERCSLSEEELIRLMAVKAYVTIMNKAALAQKPYEVRALKREYQKSKAELLQEGMIVKHGRFRYCVVWSDVDEKAITAVVKEVEGISHIITVLDDPRDLREPWAGYVPDEVIERAKRRWRESGKEVLNLGNNEDRPPRPAARFRATFCWDDQETGKTRYKSVKLIGAIDLPQAEKLARAERVKLAAVDGFVSVRLIDRDSLEGEGEWLLKL